MVTDDPRTVLEGDFTVGTVTGYLEPPEVETDLPSGVVPVEEAGFLEAMRMLPGAVVLVTTRVDGRPWGLTISSCCSLTLEPPQVLVSLRSDTVSCRAIAEEGIFGVSILSENQEHLAKLGAAPGVAKFFDEHCSSARESDSGAGPSPAISGALCHLDCRVVRSLEVSSHTVLVGVVICVTMATGGASDASPLVYVNRGFGRISRVKDS